MLTQIHAATPTVSSLPQRKVRCRFSGKEQPQLAAARLQCR